MLTEVTGPVLGEAAPARSTTTSRASTTASPMASACSSTAASWRPTAARSPTRSSRSGRPTRAAATATGDNWPSPLDPNFTGVGRCLTDSDRPLPLRDDQARRVSVGQPRERLAPGAHPLLALRARVHPAARDPDVLPGRPAVLLGPDLQLRRRPRRKPARADDQRVRLRVDRGAVGARVRVGHRAARAQATPIEERTRDDAVADRRAVLRDRAAVARRAGRRAEGTRGRIRIDGTCLRRRRRPGTGRADRDLAGRPPTASSARDFRGFGRAATDDDGVGRSSRSSPARSATARRSTSTSRVRPRDAQPRRDAHLLRRRGQCGRPVLSSVPDDRRDTLIARPTDDGYRFDVRLQGEGETVFFKV